jgi:UDP-N-acetylglucosamine 2-epimerase
LQVSGLAEPQWQAFMAVFRAQEERVLHLIEPVWSDSFHLLWQNATAGRSNSSSSEAADMSGLVRWCSVLLVRAAFHSK